jgi:hypothetical protein
VRVAARRRRDLDAAVMQLEIEGSCDARFFCNGEKREGWDRMDISQ